MGRFSDDPRAFFGQIYQATAPWDVGGAQPAMTQLLADLPPSGLVLDAGCGTGDLAIHLATSGHGVVGVEFVETAVAQAREKAAALSADVAARLRFEVADASRPSALGLDLGAIVDSGFLHLLDETETDRYVADLAVALPPRGRYYVHAFAFDFALPFVPRAITRAELATRFSEAAGWRMLDVRDVVFANRIGPPVPAIAACVERR